jgi:hypothetical protein
MILIYKQNMNIHNTFGTVDSKNMNRQTSCLQGENLVRFQSKN